MPTLTARGTVSPGAPTTMPPRSWSLTLTGFYAVTVVVSTMVGGIWSDRVGRRKPFVVAALVTGAAACALALTQTWSGAAAVCVLGAVCVTQIRSVR
ncbi:MFS transporter [Actinomyces haliotis]|uniref:MFS transporter n=1 Tax=Actinomyces haliotis TaxID=1280843 RepID=UPI001E4DA998|nr:MFS transporter [Actinomyces haliotis]